MKIKTHTCYFLDWSEFLIIPNVPFMQIWQFHPECKKNLFNNIDKMQRICRAAPDLCGVSGEIEVKKAFYNRQLVGLD